MGFTVNTLRDMKKDEIDDMMTNLFHIFRWDLLVGERYSRKPLSGRSGVTSKWRISGGATSSPATAPTPWMLSIKKVFTIILQISTLISLTAVSLCSWIRI
nr:floricaula/leafy homolog 2 [Ipomoea trifida]